MTANSNKWLFQWLGIGCIYLFVTIGLTLSGLDMAQEDPKGYLVFVIFAGSSIVVVAMIIKGLIRFQKDPLRARELLEKYNRNIHRHFIQDYTVLYVAGKKFVLVLPFLVSLVAIGIFTFLTFKLNFLSSFFSIFPENTPFYLRFLGAFYIFNFICMTIYMTGYFITGEILQRMFGMAKRNILIDVLFNYFYAIPFFLILTLLWVIFALSADRKDNESVSLRILFSLRSLSLYALFKGFQYYTFINLARISFSDIGVNVQSKEARSLFTGNRRQLLRIFFRAGTYLGLAMIFVVAIIGWNSVLGFLRFLDSSYYFPLVATVLFFFFLVALFSEQLAILFYYIKSYHPSCSFEKIGLNLDPDYIPKKEEN